MATFAERLVPFDACFNFRDLGGYETGDGRRLRWRTLYRADTLHRIDGADLDRFLGLRLRSIIDLRSWGELQEHGRFRHADGHLVVHHLPMVDSVGGRARPNQFRSPPRTAGEGYIFMTDAGRRSIGAAVRLLADPDRLPAVFHCTAGKDRTGVLAAIVLSAVGVPDRDIVADYMLTDESRAARNAYLRIHEPEYYAFLAGLPPTFRRMNTDAIPTLLTWIRAEHGSVPAFLADSGVDRHDLAALRASLLED